jgi:hypothetical protein
MMNRRLTLIPALVAFFAAPAGRSLAAEADVPRYWLKVGQELAYHTTSEFSAGDGSALAGESTWQVWVVKQNADGGWRLILRHAATLQAPASPATPPAGKTSPTKPAAPKPAKPVGGKSPTKAATTAPSKQGASKPAPPSKSDSPSKSDTPGEGAPRLLEQVTFAYCDFSPDGAAAPNPTLGFQFDPRQLLLKLPKNKSQLDKGWADVEKETQLTYRYRIESRPADDDEEPIWTIVATRQSPVDDVYLSRSQSTFKFNADRGLVKNTV